jgi:hypothetical protein
MHASPGLRVPAAHSSDIACRRCQSGDKRGVVELRIVREDRDRRGRIDRLELGKRLFGPGGDHLLGARKTLGGRESATWIDHKGPPLGPQRRFGQRECRCIESRLTERPKGKLIDADEQLRPRLGGALKRRDDCGAAAGACTFGEARLQTLGRVALDPNRDLAAAGQADVPRFAVVDAELSEAWLGSGEDFLGDLHHRALDAAAGHRADDLASVLDRHLRSDRLRRRALRVDHRREGDATAVLAPELDRLSDVGRARLSRLGHVRRPVAGSATDALSS